MNWRWAKVGDNTFTVGLVFLELDLVLAGWKPLHTLRKDLPKLSDFSPSKCPPAHKGISILLGVPKTL